jgi:hypothetical protein
MNHIVEAPLNGFHWLADGLWILIARIITLVIISQTPAEEEEVVVVALSMKVIDQAAVSVWL